MRAVFGFFLFLCFLIPRGYAVYVGAHQDTNGYPSAHQHLLLIKNSGSGNKGDDSSIVESDDEDIEVSNGQTLPVKYHLSANSLAILSYFYFYNYVHNFWLFCQHTAYHSSYKYILQRVLRI